MRDSLFPGHPALSILKSRNTAANALVHASHNNTDALHARGGVASQNLNVDHSGGVDSV
jgi:hypothetical protein